MNYHIPGSVKKTFWLLADINEISNKTLKPTRDAISENLKNVLLLSFIYSVVFYESHADLYGN